MVITEAMGLMLGDTTEAGQMPTNMITIATQVANDTTHLITQVEAMALIGIPPHIQIQITTLV